jgi:TRAP-type transport system small permease protein
MKRFDELLGAALRLLCLACLALLAAIVALSVLNRVVNLGSMGWADEIIELLFAWLVFAGAASLWRERGHFAVDLLVARLDGTALAEGLRMLLAALCIVFLAVVTVFSWQMLVSASDDSPVFAISKRFWYGVMPVSAVIMIGYSLRDFVAAARALARPRAAQPLQT